MSETIALPEKGLILPPGVAQSIAPVDKEYEEAEKKATQLPRAKGWRIDSQNVRLVTLTEFATLPQREVTA
jgi:hypothetical protein